MMELLRFYPELSARANPRAGAGAAGSDYLRAGGVAVPNRVFDGVSAMSVPNRMAAPGSKNYLHASLTCLRWMASALILHLDWDH
jgi:hypothetical protein